MKRLILAGALALAAPLYVHTDASARCRPLAERRAERRAKAAPVKVMPAVGRAVVAPVALVLRATRAVCSGAGCQK